MVERQSSKLAVVGSSPTYRSNFKMKITVWRSVTWAHEQHGFDMDEFRCMLTEPGRDQYKAMRCEIDSDEYEIVDVKRDDTGQNPTATVRRLPARQAGMEMKL